MNFLITGGCGYIGTLLTKHLLSKKNKVTVVDNCWFGNFHKKNKMLKVIKKDIRNFEDLNINGINTIVHLANIANDPAVELNPTLSWEVNVLASKLIARHAIKNKVKKIIFLSSGSVYGVKKEKKVTENLKLNPISTYNKTKMIAERVFLSFKDKIDITCIRPATVCGLSERLRLDLTVNKLTYDAFYKKKIFVDGGSQIRPNIHIKDLISAIDYLVFYKKKFNHNIYNVGFENLMISEIANKIQNKIDAKIVVNKNRDIRSYRQDSSRLLKSGFKPKYSVDFAIDELINFFQTKSKFNFTNKNFNLLRMKELNIR
tara:strand:+ start:320 stop:1267 length:948 start_codon:yes stop_codon:yes gene_type:complete